MKTVKKIVLAAAVLPLALGTASAYAFGGKQGGGKGFNDFGGKCGGFDRGALRQLDLTDEQEDQLKALRDAKREQRKADRGTRMADRMAAMQGLNTEVQDLVLAADFDEEQAKALAAKMVEKQSERQVEMLKARHDMMSILTDEQKAELKEIQAERMQECTERMNDRMNRN
ncbi:CpxP family protein [Vibrio sp. JC009]|uniref:CpxP family protein n=1 Tax=Vibrio sp. JC009 TaxID=2912314 RepID=UPI0023AF8EBC|nr:CpxP family protein [Vibrio sp. JC009]WED21663.1 CpxP family protein [Vibrio sp. JC009]